MIALSLNVQIQAVLRKYDILFIADEVCITSPSICQTWNLQLLDWQSPCLFKVITAFGRLGTMFGCDKYNIQPDLVTIAKVVWWRIYNNQMLVFEITFCFAFAVSLGSFIGIHANWCNYGQPWDFRSNTFSK